MRRKFKLDDAEEISLYAINGLTQMDREDYDDMFADGSLTAVMAKWDGCVAR